MPKTQVTSDSITDLAVTEGKIANCAVAEAKIGSNAVTSAKITDGTVAAADLASSLDLSSKTVTLPPNATSVVDQNIALLGFKMAVNDGLTVFNLVDGVVDEFHDESGTDEGEGSNDTYCSSNDNYVNQGSPVSYSAGFTMSTRTESDTSTSGTNSTQGSGTFGAFTVPSGVSSVDIQVWGAGGASNDPNNAGGGGGYAEGTLAVTASQVLHVIAGEGSANTTPGAFLGGGEPGNPVGAQGLAGAGLSGVFSTDLGPLSTPQYSAPTAYVIAGSGGGANYGGSGPKGADGGAGGGLTGDAGDTTTE